MPGYQYRAPRRPQIRLTITPEQEARIEAELAGKPAPKITDQLVGIPGKRGPRKRLAPCGTNAAYSRHRVHDEKPCEACRTAHAVYMRSRADRRPDRSRKPCGTLAAYRRHIRNGEVPCEACTEANRIATADNKKKAAA